MTLMDSIFNFCRSIIWIIIVIFVVFALMMYLNQDNLIYPTAVNGMKYPEDNPDPWKSPSQLGLKYKEVKAKTKDNVKLVGWLVFKDENVPKRAMLYFHENAGNIGFRLPFIEYVVNHLDMNIIIFGYRGYGKSEGIPSEKGLLLDGEAIGHFIFENEELSRYIDKDQIFLFGRSLGGAIAAHVALDNSLFFKGVIIENTFTTLGELVDIMFPPLKYVRGFLLKSKFETIKIIGKIKKPILFCRSENDELIPKIQMDRLYNEAKGAAIKEYYVIKNGTHNDGFRNDEVNYARAINNFIDICNNNIYLKKKEKFVGEKNEDMNKKPKNE